MNLKFDSRAFSLLAVQKACHRFSNVASFEVAIEESPSATTISVSVSPLVEKSAEGLTYLERRLRNEVLDQQLREQIRSQTEGVRNLILSHAFSKTGLIAGADTPASL
ncbi:His-Xaa-Ser system protein HxsD [Bordetella genomosp. 8]|uniref:His-Xaa-Ser system protein HxsD n=2 Tax=Bordetella genomosp. 8 TaxID=1416806 RepID=A0A1W6YFB3_9BORD|nr:His-Xaa-Ser system protein HxsD [Bordetella genomosp. 8]